MFKNKKAIIFDFDGTLADTLWAIRDASNMAREKMGFSREKASEITGIEVSKIERIENENREQTF